MSLRSLPWLLAALAGTARAQTPGQAPPANRPLLALIERYLAAPLDRRLRTALLDSADGRTDIVVELSNEVNPWACYGDSMPAIRGLDSALTAAYVAGNMGEQLAQGRRRDRPVAGLAAVLRVYAAIRDSVPTYYVPEVDEWGRAARNQRLGSVADSLKYAPTRECPDQGPSRYRGRIRIRSVPDSGGGGERR